MRCPDPALPQLFSRADARAAGLTDRQITRRLSTGAWTAVRRGVLTAAPETPGHQPVDPDVVAALRSTSRTVAVAGPQAARLWGLPRPLDGWGGIVLLAGEGPTRDRGGVVLRVAPLDTDEITVVRGVPVTSVTRTVTDCLRWLPAADALAIADAAARRLVPATGLVGAADRLAGWPGVVQARRLAALIDGRRETPLESWSAVAFADSGIPAPVWQVDLFDGAGFAGRADGWWVQGVAGEADGRAKYALAAAERSGVDAAGLAAVLHAEREREQRIRRAGADVVRWQARDVLAAHRALDLAAHLRRALSHPRTFTGTARPSRVMLPLGTSVACSAPSTRS